MWWLLLIMAVLVLVSRYVFLEPKLPFKISGKWLRFLEYTGPAVLTAIWAPIVFTHEKQFTLDFSSPYLLSASLAIMLAATTRHVLLTTVLSMTLFFFIK